MAKCENALIQSSWVGITWIYQSIQSRFQVHMNRLNQLTRITQMIQSHRYISQLNNCWPVFGEYSISLTFLAFLYQLNWFNHTIRSKSIDSITYFMKTKWLNHQSTRLEKELNQFKQFCRKKWIDLNQSAQSSWLVCRSGSHIRIALSKTGKGIAIEMDLGEH